MADLRNARTISDIMNETGAELLLYEEPATGALKYEPDVNPYLDSAELDDALFWRPYSLGNMLITGGIGSGKGAIGNMILYKMRWYFGKNILLDYKPYREFAQEYRAMAYSVPTHMPLPPYELVRETPYVPFNREIFVDQLARMSDVAMGDLKDETKADKAEKALRTETQRLASKWLSTTGQVFLRHAALGLDEVKRYHDKRRPFNPFGLLLDDVYNILRHLMLLVVGMSAYRDELDEKRYMQKVNYEIRCTWLGAGRMRGRIYKGLSVTNDGIVREAVHAPQPYNLDVFRPRAVLAGKAWKDIYKSDNAVAIAAPKSMKG